jgi:hypothetical protein
VLQVQLVLQQQEQLVLQVLQQQERLELEQELLRCELQRRCQQQCCRNRSNRCLQQLQLRSKMHSHSSSELYDVPSSERANPSSSLELLRRKDHKQQALVRKQLLELVRKQVLELVRMQVLVRKLEQNHKKLLHRSSSWMQA